MLCNQGFVRSKGTILCGHENHSFRFFWLSLRQLAASQVQAQDATASPESQTTFGRKLAAPTVAPDYRGQQKPLPELNRVGDGYDASTSFVDPRGRCRWRF